MNNQNNQNLITGGQLYQQDQQGQDNAALPAMARQQDQRQNDLLNRYYGIIGGNNWGGTATGTTPGPSMFQNLLGAASKRRWRCNGVLRSSPQNERRADRRVHQGRHPACGFDYVETPGLDLPRGRQVGVMATDVAKVRRDAIGVKDGYLQVDYGKLR
jgi:hypothetical protein